MVALTVVCSQLLIITQYAWQCLRDFETLIYNKQEDKSSEKLLCTFFVSFPWTWTKKLALFRSPLRAGNNQIKFESSFRVGNRVNQIEFRSPFRAGNGINQSKFRSPFMAGNGVNQSKFRSPFRAGNRVNQSEFGSPFRAGNRANHSEFGSR